MPKRMLDDSLLTSPSLARLSPRAQDAFPRFVLLADDFGCFEVIPRVLLAKGWPYRSDVTEVELAAWLAEYEGAGMLWVWIDGERTFGYLTGWHGDHGQKHRSEYDPKTNVKGSKRRTPRPPGFDPANSRWLPAREKTVILADLKIPSPFVPARETGGTQPGNGGFPPPQFQSQSQFQSQGIETSSLSDSLTLVAPDSEQQAPKRRKANPALDALEAQLSAVYREVKGEELDWPKSAHGELHAIRKVLADDVELERRWRLFLADAFWPIKNVHKFRDAFQHAKFQRKAAAVAGPAKLYPGIPEFT